MWAPATVAVLFVVAGSYLFWTSDRSRRYRVLDAAVLLTSALTVLGSFLYEWRTVANQGVPQHFPAGVYWIGVLLGTAWFVHAERRDRRFGSPMLRAFRGGPPIFRRTRGPDAGKPREQAD